MAMPIARRGVVAVALCAVLAAIWASPAGATGAGLPGVELSKVTQSAQQVREYWTPARMRNAVPIGMGIGKLSANPNRASSAKRSGLHTEVQKMRKYPRSTHGKVFFTLSAVDYVCSGTAVRSPNQSLVWTAGHCVSDPGLFGPTFATNWEFVPAFRNGTRPFGTWQAAQLGTTAQWGGTSFLSGGDTAYDFGTAKVFTRNGRHLQEVVGGRRIAFNQPRGLTYKAFGYPAVQPPAEFDGRHEFRCQSPYRGSDPTFGPPYPIHISCDMTGGASGGGWVVRRNGKAYVASVTSYIYNDDSQSLYGPYQGGVAQNLYSQGGGN